MKIKFPLIVLFFFCPTSTLLKAQETKKTLEGTAKALQKFNVSGYIQAQYQYGGKDADGVNVGNDINAWEKENEDGFSRFGIRRGRIKLTYTDSLVEGVFQPDITERGISVKDVYLSIKDPFWGTNALKAGIFNCPFGNEVGYSSARRESPERSRIIQSLFPDGRDAGAMLTLQAAKNSPWNILKLEAGIFAGNGIRPEIDSKMDFIGHLSAKKIVGNMEISGGISAYLGGVFQGNDTVYVMKNNEWEIDSNTGNKGNFAKRRYIGADLQYSITTVAGLTQFRGEYILGEHPGTVDEAYDFKLTALPTNKTFMRNISGGYVIVTQELGALPFTLVAKYDWYNPNTNVSGNNIKGAGEIMKSTIGLGAFWRINNALRLTAYYEFVKNETSENLNGYEKDCKDNVFTFRLQYRF